MATGGIHFNRVAFHSGRHQLPWMTALRKAPACVAASGYVACLRACRLAPRKADALGSFLGIRILTWAEQIGITLVTTACCWNRTFYRPSLQGPFGRDCLLTEVGRPRFGGIWMLLGRWDALDAWGLTFTVEPFWAGRAVGVAGICSVCCR